MNPPDKGYSILFSDLWIILKRRWRILVAASFAIGLFAFFYSLTGQPLFKTEASFRDKAKLSAGLNSELFIGLVSEKHDSEAVSAMKSLRLITPIVNRLHWHASLDENRESRSWKEHPYFVNAKNNLSVEWLNLMGEKRKSIPDKELPLALTFFEYSGENPLSLELHFIDDTHFVIEGDLALTEGLLNEPLEHKEIRFTLTATSDEPLLGRTFSLSARNPLIVAEEMSKQLTIKPDLDNRTLILLSLKGRDRFEGALFLNSLMREYQAFLEEEHQKSSEKQLAYLDEREKEIAERLASRVSKQAESFSREIAASGFIDSKKELEFLTAELTTLKSRLFELSLNEKRLKKLLHTPFATFDKLSARLFDPEVINRSIEEMRRVKELHDLAEQKLRNYPDQFEVAIEEGTKRDTSFSNLSFASAREWAEKMGHQCAEVECTSRELAFLLNQFDNPTFEMSSLSPFVNDPLSRERLIKSTEISFSLREASTYSERELERLRNDLQREKEFLKSHLKESERLFAEKKERLSKESFLLWKRIMQLAEDETYHLQKQLRDFVASRLSTQEIEKEMVRRQASEIERRIALLPQNWVHETLFDHLLKADQRMGENISTLVESKNISTNLEVIQSSPLDTAIVPLMPMPPRLLFSFIGGSFVGAIASALLLIARGISKKTPLTRQNLRLNGFTTLGNLYQGKKISPTTLFDIAGLIDEKKGRHILLFTHDGKIMAPLHELFLKRGENPHFIEIQKNDPLALQTELAQIGEESTQKAIAFTGLKEPLPITLLQQFDLVLVGLRKETVQELSTLLEDLGPEKLAFFFE